MMKWSLDGQSLAFVADKEGNENYDIYVISANGGAPRRLTTDPAVDQWPFWAQDGQSIYFRSNRSGTYQIWKMPAGGGDAVQITWDPDGVDLPQESPDGKFVYYCKGWPLPISVWRLPVEGGKATKVLDGVHPTALWAIARDGIYFFKIPDEEGDTDLSNYDFATGKTRKILTVERPVTWYVDVSPDGRTILWPQVDEAGSDLMLVENFR
jgi:Tol biopolymer transport system component